MASTINISLNDIMEELKLIREEINELKQERELSDETIFKLDDIIENKKWLSKKESQEFLNSL